MRLFPVVAAIGVLLASCGEEPQADAPRPLEVETVVIQYEEVPNAIELPGRVEPVREAEVRARVTGIVQRRLYQEGTNVSEGQPLFLIDPSELRASYAQTEASLERARATAANADAVVERYRPLVEENAISRQEYDAAIAASREARANVAQIEAELRSASLQLGYTTVRAPISGRVSRAQVTEGALVSQPEGTLMTRIEQMSPVYVSFSQSASEMLRIRRGLDTGEIQVTEGEPVEVWLKFADGTEYPIPGVLDFLDQSVDPTTGTVQLRAEFPNPESLLLPGEFVRARILAGRIAKGISIPQEAVTVGENGGSVYVISRDGTAEVRQVALGAMTGGNWLIEDGLRPGDVLITNNLQKLQPGMPVKSASGHGAAQPSATEATGTPPAKAGE
ncbi:membrane fusion protein (multidrug efflux system) [Altererythrobacter atlanticus]|uniref:Toluene efflux pump periplasmic linker protein TtgA n=1 Tax=Croceibacterium atlanticum TaxID=1267766 RepID=A0A0F7KUK5_9SPHN|nr:efflux RND transporter periplasmic adaptor subunit [Croceibacterium atlanticum]AKH42866.1 Toluene efflux pump periplasmic linker protein TtgA precursor [Croceibacterium atlanticum]MBB5731646.1 membrane fusion protein (multidrug efflux system) [Croceibacterium atlanticum]